MLKKRLKLAGWMLLLVCLLGFCYLLFGGAWMNDLRARRIERELTQLELPAGTELVEVTSFVGNTSGTGNHVEIWAGILVHSTCSKQQLAQYFGPDRDVSVVPQDLVHYYPYAKDFIEFRTLNGVSDGAGYFVVSSYYEAFTQIDLRGS